MEKLIKRFGLTKIDTYATDFSFDDGTLKVPILQNEKAELVLNTVWEIYGKKTGFELIDLTHQDDTPWAQSYKENEKFIIIDKNDIKEYFTKRLKNIINSY